jgi:tRNA A-37 threonylcarbamoyl transferase component Bud32
MSSPRNGAPQPVSPRLLDKPIITEECTSPITLTRPKYSTIRMESRKLTQVQSFGKLNELKSPISQPPQSPTPSLSVSPKELSHSISLSKMKSSKVLQQGYLVKEGSFWKVWRKRWFVLKQDGEFNYRKDFLDKNPIKTLNVRGAALTFPEIAKKNNVMKLYFSPEHSLYMLTGDDLELEKWAKSFIDAGASAVEIKDNIMLSNLELDRYLINGEIYIPKEKHIDDEFIRIESKLGEGAQATVYCVTLENVPDHKFASKVYPKKLINGVNDLTQCYNEMYVMSCLTEHENVLQFYGVTEKKESIGILTEFCAQGPLSDNITQKKTFKQKISMITQIVLGIQHLHRHGIVHRDIKCDNILISSNFVIKIGDFGLATKLPIKGVNGGVCGTASYVAPEILLNLPYDEKCDIYSFGIVLWMIMHEQLHPYNDMTDSDIIARVKKDVSFKPDIENSIGSTMKNLILSCLSRDPKKRPNCDQILNILKEL